MRVHLVLDPKTDHDLIEWWLTIPKGQRTEVIRRILRWYVIPGGFADLIAALPARIATPVADSGPSVAAPVADLSTAMAQQMTKWWGDDD